MESKGAVGSEGYPVTDTISFEGGGQGQSYGVFYMSERVFSLGKLVSPMRGAGH